MKSILVIAILCVSHIGLSKEEIYTLKKQNEIELHNSIQMVISNIDIENLSQKNQKPLKQNLSELALKLLKFTEISKIKTLQSEYDDSLQIKYTHNNYEYQYHYSEIGPSISFKNLNVDFSKHKIIEDDDNEDNTLVYSYSFIFNDDSNLSSLTIDSGLIYRSSEYTKQGAPINHKLRVNYKTIGKNYTTFIYSDEINEDIANTLNLKHSKVSVVTNYTGNIDSVISTEFLINHQDTMGYSIGYISRYSTINKIGKWITYYKNGNMALEHSYTPFNDGHSNSKLNGKETYFYNTGDTAVIQFYVNGKLNGKKTEFFAKNKPKMTEYYKDGIHIGEKNTYYEDGTKWTIEKYSNEGYLNGTWLSYDQHGKLKYKIHFKNGFYDGDYLHYRHGILIDSCRYVDSKIENYRIKYYDFFDFNGNTITSDVIHYKNGQLDGEFISYYNNGITSDSCFYVEGKKHGLSTQFYKDGSIKKKTNYNHGTILNSISYYKSGKIKQNYNFNIDTEIATDTNYYKNGIISEIKSFKIKDKKYGHWVTKDVNGNLTSDILYHSDNVLDGFEMKKNGDEIDSILYDSKLMTMTFNNYKFDKLVYHKTVRYDIITEYFNSNLTKIEEGKLKKVTYYVDLSDLDNKEEWDKSNKDLYTIGEKTSYYLNGHKKETIIKTDIVNVWKSQITYFKNGNIKTIKMNEDYGYGVREVNFNKNGQVINQINEIERTAIYNYYYKNDSLKQSVRYQDSNKEITEYYPNGKIISITYLENVSEYDFQNKKFNYKFNYNSKKIKYFNEQGIITREVLSYYNGEETSTIIYKNGKTYMKEQYYNDYTDIYFYGVLSTRDTYYPNGKIKSYQYYEYSDIYNRSIIVKQETYYESGGIKSKKQWGKYAEKIGDWIYYNDDAIIDKEGKTIKEPSIKEKH